MEDIEQGFMVYKVNSDSLGTSLNDLRKAGELCDITIKVGEAKIDAHKVVLSARSSVFRAMICGGFKESNQHEIELKEECVTGHALSTVLEFLYTGLINIENNPDLDKLGDILQGNTKCKIFISSI